MRRLFLLFGFIIILFSCNHHLLVTEINTKNTVVESKLISGDQSLELMVSPYRDSLKNTMSKVVAVSAVPLIKDKPESNLTNLVTDILLDFGKEYCHDSALKIIPDAAYMNYGGLRASLPQGEITVERIFELMPFENEIVLIKISGKSFLSMAEKIAARGGEGVAGLKLGIKENKVSSLKIGENDFDPAKTYWLVTNDYIANGGDQMSMFLNPEQRIDTKAKIRDVLIERIGNSYKKNGAISVHVDGRIYNEQ